MEIPVLYAFENKEVLRDYAIRRNGGRLLAVVDFSLDEELLETYMLEGNVVEKEINTYDYFGIPKPEGTGSDRVLRVRVAAGGTVYIRIPIKARYYTPFSAYLTVYAKDYSVNVSPYVTLGGILSGSRQKLPRYLKLPPNKWGRFMVHWFMESHHGCTEIVIEINNTNAVDVDVFIGVVTAGEIGPYIKGHSLLYGWEDVYELELNNETLTFYVHIMIPTNACKVASMTIEYGIAGDGTNPLSIEVIAHPSGKVIISDSNASTTPKTSYKDFKILTIKRGPYPFEFMLLEVRLSTAGTGKLTKLSIVLKALADEYIYQKYIETSVAGGATTTLLDFTQDLKHIVGGCVEVTAPPDGSVDILADTPEGEITIYRIPAGSTERIEFTGRYNYLKVRNNGSFVATVRATIQISDSLLPT